MDEKEFILCAAIDYEGVIICGHRHGDCYATLKMLKSVPADKLPSREYQGFITSLNRFVDRKEAWNIALVNNQIKYGFTASDNGEESILISENLY